MLSGLKQRQELQSLSGETLGALLHMVMPPADQVQIKAGIDY